METSENNQEADKGKSLNDHFYSSKELEAYLNITAPTRRKWEKYNRIPKSIKLGRRSFYSKKKLDEQLFGESSGQLTDD